MRDTPKISMILNLLDKKTVDSNINQISLTHEEKRLNEMHGFEKEAFHDNDALLTNLHSSKIRQNVNARCAFTVLEFRKNAS